VVFFNPEGKCELTYAWGLGESTNNQEEALSLYQGLNILSSKEIRSLIVISDSLVIIQKM
jgi:ribonuclease HI